MKTTSSGQYWAFCVGGDLLVGGLLAIYVSTGFEGASTAYQMWSWVMVVLGIIVGTTGDRTTFRERPVGFLTYHIASEAVLVTATAWVGLPWLAAMRVVAVLLIEGAREREPDVPKNGREAA